MMEKKDIISMVEIQLKTFVEAKRSTDEEIRKQLDFGYSWDGQDALLYEIRPQWDNPTVILEHPFAKLRHTKSSNMWKLYWQRASGKWQAYGPKPEAPHLQELLTEIGRDEYSCFFG